MKIDVKGPIVGNDEKWIYDFFGMDATSPKSVLEGIEGASGNDIEININSGGGSVFAGSEIYTALKEYEGDVTVKIVGLAASAASVIAMAGDKVLMSPTAQIMIHNAHVRAQGDYRDMDRTSGILKNVNQTIANAYKMRSNLSDEQLKDMMDEETWLTPQQAQEHGFIDEVMFEQVEIAASAGFTQMLPPEVIQKVRNELLNKQPDQEEEKPSNDSAIFMAKLNLLKLRKDVEDE